MVGNKILAYRMDRPNRPKEEEREKEDICQIHHTGIHIVYASARFRMVNGLC